jgi:hypothetical protein
MRAATSARVAFSASRAVEVTAFDDDGWLFVDGYSPANNVRDAAEMTLPIAMTNDRSRLRTLTVVGHGETASE